MVSNAIKFSPVGGTVTIVLSSNEDQARLQLTDQGPGIPENELETVFDKFVQSSKTKTGAGGTGLGLAICRQIILKHRGRIWAENNEKQGARFQFEIPLIQGEEGTKLFL